MNKKVNRYSSYEIKSINLKGQRTSKWCYYQWSHWFIFIKI